MRQKCLERTSQGHSIGGHHAMRRFLFALMGKHRSFHESKTYERDLSLLKTTSLTLMQPQPEVQRSVPQIKTRSRWR
jgi:hypothetical protein